LRDAHGNGARGAAAAAAVYRGAAAVSVDTIASAPAARLRGIATVWSSPAAETAAAAAIGSAGVGPAALLPATSAATSCDVANGAHCIPSPAAESLHEQSRSGHDAHGTRVAVHPE
jgi:hypothetical protein